ncbi:hypothetical protein N5853_14310 (plasmid) [Bartonella sp. HY329]|uniref:tetratricopeptide repeat protein n=1 Tax=unclassified Bartonella TaxID=2645622 RepID=UPI0021C70DBC|nr:MULTISPECIES: hypothetical protein [unclassified Bartonella]UXM96489.1 hypothetical protein N5853_14310 [Bartonella sp. HY329]UXN10812.1 hypothetical protein N5852_14315 [Bartonella sp. HY328]
MASIVKRAGFLTIALSYALNQSAKKLGSALNHLGILYYKRNGLKRNFSEAFKWFSRAAEQGDMNAQNNLGLLYNNG